VAAIGNPFVPNDPDFIVDGGLRPPVAQRFAARDNGGGFWFVVNHLKSKGSCPSSASSVDTDTGQGCWNAARVRQAQALTRWVGELVAASGEADVLMAGDFNAYLKEDPLAVLAGGGFANLLERLDPLERYSYVFESEAGALDHALSSASLAPQVAGVAVWHSNADEPPVLDYNTEFKTDDRYAPSAFRASDHDPVLVGLALHPDAPVSAPTLEARLPSAGVAGTPIGIDDIRATLSSAGAAASLSVDWGDGHGPQALPVMATSAANTYAEAGTYAVRLRLEEANGLAAELVTTLRVAPRPPDPAAGLLISEYVEGSAVNKAIEIFNPGTAAVDLATYTLRLYSNGSATATASFVLSGTLAPGAVVVIYNPGFALPAVPAGALVSGGAINFNGDDALTLEANGVVVDQFGQVGFDPGTAWISGALTTLDRTLRRKAGIVRGSVPPAAPGLWDLALEWDVLPQNTVDGLGVR
jgi:predicted extracellular nuclease